MKKKIKNILKLIFFFLKELEVREEKGREGKGKVVITLLSTICTLYSWQ